MKKTPLAEVKDRFGSKENLVKEIQGLFDKSDLFENRLSADKGLRHVTNAKLLKLHAVATEVKERFSTRSKMVDDLLKTMKREKDADFKAKLGTWGLPRLWDYYKITTQRLSK